MTTLYHYCSNQAFLSIVRNQTIRLSSLTQSNDSMEGKHLAQAFKSFLEGKNVDQETHLAVMRAAGVLEDFLDGLGFCLSEHGDLLSQWRGYANDGMGVAIGFSKDYLQELAVAQAEGTPRFVLRQVLYSPAEHKKALEPIFEKIAESVDSGRLRFPIRPTLLIGPGTGDKNQELEKKREEHKQAVIMMLAEIFRAVEHLFSLKHWAFREEAEWRLVSFLMKSRDEACDFRAMDNRIIPCRSFALQKLTNPAIQEVILGPKNVTPESEIQRLLTHSGYPDVTITRSNASYR